MVLYSGTACQIAGLRKFLKQEYDNLLTVEVACHGVPSPGLFRKYIDWIEKNTGKKVSDYQFRNKEKHKKGEHYKYCVTFADESKKYGFSKVRKIVSGGAERYNSVWNGLQQITEKDGFVYIHDGARPFVDDAMIERAYRCVEETKACVAGMPVKDTIKVVDEKNYVKGTPERKTLWLVQTPQVFNIQLIKEAYQKLINEKIENATDDAMVVEQMMGHTVKLYPGAYENIKITTPEDLLVAEAFL